MMLASMAAHHIPILSSRDPTPTDVHQDLNMKDIALDAWNNTVSTTPESNRSTPVATQMNDERTETITDITSQTQMSALPEAERASVEVQTEINTGKNNTKTEVHSEIVQKSEPGSSLQPEVPDSNYTTAAPVKDVSPEINITESSSPENLDTNQSVAEDMHKQDGPDHEEDTFKNVSLANDPSLATESDSEAEHSDSTTTKVARLIATYDSSGESQTVMAAEPKGSLFGGPAGPQIPVEPDIAGFEDMFEEEAPDAPTNNILQEDSGVGMNSFDFSKPSSEEDAEPEAEAGAEQDVPSQPPNADHDAKPDMNASHDPMSPDSNADHDAKPDMNASHDPMSPDSKYGAISPTYSNAPSNISHASQSSSASEIQETLDYISGDLYGVAADSKETPEEFSKHEQVVEKQPPCSCEHHCGHRVIDAFGLRPGPRQEGCVYFSNTIWDNDTSGTFDNEHGKYPSAQRVDTEDLDEDEESLNDGATDPIGRYNTTIPFNHTETQIRDRRVFDEESSSSDESQTKAKKKRKKTRTKSSKPTRKSKNNNGIATPRASDSDDEDIQIDEQTSTPAPKPPATKKKPPSTAVPNQTIVQMLQRLAKPHLTKLSYPVNFNSTVSSCSICNSASYAIYGASPTPRKIKIYDFGQGNTEIPDANQAGNVINSATAIKPKDTNLCLACTTGYMKILMCSTHEISSITPLPSSSPSSPSHPSPSSHPSQIPPSYTPATLQTTCSICPTPATYTCDLTCGAKFCDTCAGKLYGKFDGSLSRMLEGMTDEITPEYARGLRADVELLRKGGELWRFLGRMARMKGA
jgi:hypothetical protein